MVNEMSLETELLESDVAEYARIKGSLDSYWERRLPANKLHNAILFMKSYNIFPYYAIDLEVE